TDGKKIESHRPKHPGTQLNNRVQNRCEEAERRNDEQISLLRDSVILVSCSNLAMLHPFPPHVWRALSRSLVLASNYSRITRIDVSLQPASVRANGHLDHREAPCGCAR